MSEVTGSSAPKGTASTGRVAEPSRIAASLRLTAALLALLAASLLAAPELMQLRSAPPEHEERAVPLGTMLVPAFDAPAARSAGPFVVRSTPLEQGSVLMVESEPAEAEVIVDGVAQGRTPVSLTLECGRHPGPVRVEVRRRGYAAAAHELPCNERTMTQLTARLSRRRTPRP